MITPEQERLIRHVRDADAGDSISEELMNGYHVGKTDEMMVPTRDGETHVHIHYPDSDHTLYPLFINIHGGGFIKRHRRQDTVFCKNMCGRAQCVVMDIDYTPAPEQRYPYALHQCYDVVKWAHDRSDSLRVDPAHTALCGHSSGGNIAAAITIMNHERHDFTIALQILDYPCLDLYTPPHLKRNAYKDPRRVSPYLVEQITGVYVDDALKLDPTVSPLFAPDETLIGLPEAVVLTCGDDFMGEEAERYAYRLLEAGVPVTARRFLASSHGFVVRRKDQFEEAEEMILAALGRMFAR
jgi:acetyl esterase